jgi:lysophospholipase L1-like esterase
MKYLNPAPFFQGHISLEETDQGVKPWRLPFYDRELFPSPNDSLMTRAEKASGVRLAFLTDGDNICLTYRAICEDTSYAFDLTQGEEILESVKCDFAEGEKTLEIPLTGSSKQVYSLWLSQFCDIIVSSVEIKGGTFVSTPGDSRLKWLTYGSSITHCRQADSPAQIWPAVAARKLNLNLTAMGFGGQCHFDGMVGKVIRDREADLITLKLGINVYGGGTLSERTYLPAVINLIDTIREKHPLTPLGIISPIYSCHRETEPNPHGNTLVQYREWDKLAVEIFQKRGDKRIIYFDGLELFGPGDADLLPDDLHPNNEGYRRMGERAAEKLLPRLIDML